MKPAPFPLVVSMVFASCGLVAGQVPEGWLALASRSNAARPGGILLLHPLGLGGSIPVGGLGPRLAPPPQTLWDGPTQVLVRASDGLLIAGESATAGNLHLHLLTLSGPNVMSDVTIPIVSIGPSSIAMIEDLAWLPDGSVVVEVLQTQAPGPDLHSLRRVSLTSGAVTPLPVPLGVPSPGTFLDMAVDAAGTTVYWMMEAQGPPSGRALWSAPLDGSSPPVQVLSGDTFGDFAFDADGTLYLIDAGSLLHIDPLLGVLASTPFAPPAPGGADPLRLAIEPGTGDVFAAANVGTQPSTTGVPLRISAGGALMPLIALPTTIGPVTGLAVRPAARRFGPAVQAAGSYDWAHRMFPGGPPLAGNLGFRLAWSVAPACVEAWFALSLGAAVPPVNVGAVPLSIDVAQIFYWTNVPCAPNASIPLPIPPLPALIGRHLYGQAVFLDTGGAAVVPALDVTIL